MAANGVDGQGTVSHFDNTSTIPFWLNGKEVTTSKTFDVISPVSHEVLYKCSAASEEDAQAAIAGAENAFKTWSKTKPAARRDIFLRAAEIFLQRREELWQYVRNETGAERAMFDFESGLAADAFKHIAGLIPTVQGSIPTTAEEGSNALMLREPYGVVLGIARKFLPFACSVEACRIKVVPIMPQLLTIPE